MDGNRVVMPVDVNLDRNRARRVVFYGRVSTEHEAQISALQNQLQWYDDQAKFHPNWLVQRKYIDEGITGTQAKKRPSFLEMVADARKHKFDLIVTREVCRFARNTVDTLVVTRELKALGVEVYFVEDNIWTMDGDGELRLTIMATLAQEESRKTSERVRAGQKISRDKGVLYGNGNILGYKRVGDTYEIVEEEAETVRMIYDMYESGMGMQRIRNELIKRGRKDKEGLVRWECTKISRMLHNATYKGYQGYLKSHRDNYLSQKAIINRDESTYLYVKGKYEPIISEEQWEHCKAIRERRVKTVGVQTEEGETLKRKLGVFLGKDIWTNKLRCRCGCKFRKNKWRKRKGGEIVYGYKCYNQLNNGGKIVRDIGKSDVHPCDLRELCGWKLEMMGREIFVRLFQDVDGIMQRLKGFYNGLNAQGRDSSFFAELNRLKAKLGKVETRLKNLTEMRMDGEISKEDYLERRLQLDTEKEELQKIILESEQNSNHRAREKVDFEAVQAFLQEKLVFDNPQADRDLLDKFVKCVVPETETTFNWYLDFSVKEKSIEDQELLFEFVIDFDYANEYKKKVNGMLRRGQWEDLTVRIYSL